MAAISGQLSARGAGARGDVRKAGKPRVRQVDAREIDAPRSHSRARATARASGPGIVEGEHLPAWLDTSAGGERVERGVHPILGSWEQMPVPVEDGHDRGVAGPRSDLVRCRSSRDPEGNCSVSEVVRAQRRNACGSRRRHRESPAPAREADRTTFGRGEDKAIRGGELA